jgi:hypothetical protein
VEISQRHEEFFPLIGFVAGFKEFLFFFGGVLCGIEVDEVVLNSFGRILGHFYAFLK